MKIGKIITTIETNDLEITGATLLTVKEAESLPRRLRTYERWWWLQSQGVHRDHAADVLKGGSIDRSGTGVHYCDFAVRPALKFKNIESSNLVVGDVFIFGEMKFEVIDDATAFCLGDIGGCAFRKDWQADDANIYEKSDIKKFVDEWFEKAKQENK